MSLIVKPIKQPDEELTPGEAAFNILPRAGGRYLDWETREWQPADGQRAWRVPLHGRHAGLSQDKILGVNGYARSNADMTQPDVIVPPPKVNSITPTLTGVIVAPVIRDKETTTYLTSTTATHTFNMPANVTDGDILILVAGFLGSNTDTVTDPAGWTELVNSGDTNGFLARVYIGWKVASSEPATYAFTSSPALNSVITVIAFSSGITGPTPTDQSAHDAVDAGSDVVPVPAAQQALTGANRTVFITPSVTPGAARNIAICAIMLDSTPASSFSASLSPDGNIVFDTFAELVDIASSDGGAGFAVGMKQVKDTSALQEYFSAPLLSTFRGYMGVATFDGAATTTATLATSIDRMIQFNDTWYSASGRYLLETASNYATIVKFDFGSGNVIESLAVADDKLVIALSGSPGIYTMSTDGTLGFGDASTGDTLAPLALAQVDEKLWVGNAGSKLQNTISDPTRVSGYVPASPNEYRAGSSEYNPSRIAEYLGVPWVKRRDGVYAPDQKARFHNQTPQARQWPATDDDGCLFVAWGYLWSDSPAGLLRITDGESFPFGPELTNMPSYRPRVYDGLQFGNDVYLTVADIAASEQSFIAQGRRIGENEIAYHEWVRLGSTTAAKSIGIYTKPTNPSLMIGHGTTLKYIKLGRGGGRHIDDANYDFGVSWFAQFGKFSPIDDMGVENMLVGVEAVLDFDASESGYFEYQADNGTWYELLDNQAVPGSRTIVNTKGYNRVRRFAAPNTNGKFFDVRFTGTVSDTISGTDRPEIREVYAYGYSHPSVTDVVSIAIDCSGGAIIDGMKQGETPDEIARYWTYLKDRGIVFEIDVNGYDENVQRRFFKVDEVVGKNTHESIVNSEQEIVVIMTRIDYAGDYSKQ